MPQSYADEDHHIEYSQSSFLQNGKHSLKNLVNHNPTATMIEHETVNMDKKNGKKPFRNGHTKKRHNRSIGDKTDHSSRTHTPRGSGRTTPVAQTPKQRPAVSPLSPPPNVDDSMQGILRLTMY